MKILYDHQIFTIQHYGGISRYFCELMDRYSQNTEINFRLSLRYSQNDHLSQMPQLNAFWTQRNNFFSDSPFFSDLQKKIHINVLNHIFNNQNESISCLKISDFDIFHPTYFDPYFLKYLGKHPFILTIYDMIHEQYPSNFDYRDPTRARKKILAEKAKKIIAISDSTKADIVKFLNIDPGNIEVIPLASSLHLKRKPEGTFMKRENNLPEKYLLFIGNRFGYKNFLFMVEALFPVFRNHEDLHLLCAGGGKFQGPEVEVLRKLNLTSRVHNYPADDTTLLQLYKNACAFVFPSLYEGFGIPILEAFSCGCPAVLSNTSSFPEVGGTAALYFDPVDKMSLIHAIERILSDKGLRGEMKIRGFEQARLFSWEKTAAKTKEVYEVASE